MQKILLAVPPQVMSLLSKGLDGHFKLVPCTTLDEAHAALLGGDIDLALCGIYFDESRMFDLLRYAQAYSAVCDIPFLCIRSMDDHIPATFLQGAEIAARALGAREFIDFLAWRKQWGDDMAFEQLRELISRYL